MLLLAALLSAPISKLEACSISVICPHHGFEAVKNFTVTVLHAGKPLPGVLLEVIPDGDGLDITGITEASGVIQFENLRPGKYHISVSMLGINTVYQCFHVSKWTTGLTAKRALTYNWGDDAPETRQISGKLTSRYFPVDSIGQHPDDPSVAGIHLILTDPLSGMHHETTSSPEGFSFPSGIAEGVYVLHSDGNERLRFNPGDILIRLSPTAPRKELMLELGGGGGDCRSPLELVN